MCAKPTICLVSEMVIVRRAIRQLLASHGVAVLETFEDAADLEKALEANADIGSCDVIVLILSGHPFETIFHLRDAIKRHSLEIPLVVLSEQISRAQMYAALRAGAKAYVSLNSQPEELVRAIRLASRHQVHLSPEAAQLLVEDVSTSSKLSGHVKIPRGKLSDRELQIVQLLCEGLSSKEIGHRLHISSKTVENHRYNIYRKCEVDSIAALMRHAIHTGMISI